MMQDDFPDRQVITDYYFHQIEKRGLQFLLRDRELGLYKEWLGRSEEYKERIKKLKADIDIVNK